MSDIAARPGCGVRMLHRAILDLRNVTINSALALNGVTGGEHLRRARSLTSETSYQMSDFRDIRNN